MATELPPSRDARREGELAPMSIRGKVVVGLGVVMVLLGAWIALRPVLPGARPITSSRVLDVAFALFFVVRGLMNVRTGLRARG